MYSVSIYILLMVREARLEEAISKCGGSDPITGEEIAKVNFCKAKFIHVQIIFEFQ